MRPLLRVLATGFFALLPVLLIYLLLGQLFEMMMALTTPIVDLLPPGVYGEDERLVAAILLVLLAALVGLAARTRTGVRFGDWLEEKALSKVPLYSMLRNLASRFAGNEQLANFRPALMETWPNSQAIVFVVEEHTDGNYTIFQPIAPTPSVGFVQIIPRDRVRLLNVPAGTALSAVLSWGDGAEAAVRPRPSQGTEKEKGEM